MAVCIGSQSWGLYKFIYSRFMIMKTLAIAAALPLTTGMIFSDTHMSKSMAGGEEIFAEKNIIKIQ